MKKTLSASSLSKKTGACRVCKNKALTPVLSLGQTPPANAFLKQNQLKKPEPNFPLNLQFCRACSFVQLSDVVSPELLFRNYVYVSSTSPVFVSYFENLSKILINRLNLPPNALVVDIGSNDGILLRPFKNQGFTVLGIDPAKKIAAAATKSGIKTIPEFFTPALAKKIAAKYGRASLVAATSAFPHIHDLDNVIKGIKTILAPDGVFMVEAYYLGSLLEKNLFDTVYHEHLSYFTVKTISKLMKRLGLEVFDVEISDTHGGSLRVFSQIAGGPRAKNREHIHEFENQEKEKGLHRTKTFTVFAQKIEANKKSLRTLLASLKTRGKRIIGYGAPAKGNTLLNYFQIGPDTLDYIVDDSPWKQGLYTPGTHIPVFGSEKLLAQKPDYILILAWNFAEPIMNKLSDYKINGGKFIIPVPTPHII